MGWTMFGRDISRAVEVPVGNVSVNNIQRHVISFCIPLENNYLPLHIYAQIHHSHAHIGIRFRELVHTDSFLFPTLWTLSNR